MKWNEIVKKYPLVAEYYLKGYTPNTPWPEIWDKHHLDVPESTLASFQKSLERNDIIDQFLDLVGKYADATTDIDRKKIKVPAIRKALENMPLWDFDVLVFGPNGWAKEYSDAEYEKADKRYWKVVSCYPALADFLDMIEIG